MTAPKPSSRMIDRLDMFARSRNLTDAQITRDCRLAVGTLGKSRKEGKDLSKRTAAAILEFYTDLNPEWLINGESEMIRQATPVTDELVTYPLIDSTVAECGRAGGLSEAAMETDCERIAIPGLPHGTDFFIRASGYSMVNNDCPELSIPPGSFVGVARMGSASIMHWGEIYIVSTIDGIMIKRLMQDADPDYIRCVSYNKEYPDFSIRKDEIIECGRITCVVPIYLR